MKVLHRGAARRCPRWWLASNAKRWRPPTSITRTSPPPPDFGKLADGAVFLVLEFVQGKNLRDQVAQGPFDILAPCTSRGKSRARSGAAHAQSIVHRDLEARKR